MQNSSAKAEFSSLSRTIVGWLHSGLYCVVTAGYPPYIYKQAVHRICLPYDSNNDKTFKVNGAQSSALSGLALL